MCVMIVIVGSPLCDLSVSVRGVRSTASVFLANEGLIVTESNAVLKIKIQKLHQTVVTNVNPASIMDFLFQEAIIGADDMEALQRVKDREGEREQCRKLLTLLHTSQNPQAFVQLYLAIKHESHLQWLVERIDNESVIDLLQQLYVSKPTGCVNMCFSDRSVGKGGRGVLPPMAA